MREARRSVKRGSIGEVELPVAIVGSGFGGLGMAIALRRAGFEEVTVFEKADRLGGTWRDNTYPGAACDIPSHLYSFSFDPGAGWSRAYAPQPEILAYLEGVAARHGVTPRIRFQAEIARAELDEGRGRWRLTTAGGETHEARVVIFAVGQLGRPSLPALPNRFAGPQLHSARWDARVALDGRRVAVIGTGASAIQIVPELATRAAELLVFQRSAPWIVPRGDVAYSARARAAYDRVPGLRGGHRLLQYLGNELRFAAIRTQGGFFSRMAEKIARRHLESQIPDPALRARLTPDHPIGCKRILVSDDYYPALARPNVRLVTDAITGLDEGGVVTTAGRHEVDAVVWATGFHSTELLAPIEIAGRAGRSLAGAWRDGAEAYLGITVAGFPNLFILYGPNTNLAHNSIIYMLESQIRYVVSCLEAVRARGLDLLEVRAERQRAHNEELQARLAGSVWTGCSNWYRHASGRVVSNWPGWTFEYRRLTRRMDPRDFDL
jgi:cation diffusion facilitator CzcD-associated flavoprotein CzcO